MTDEAKNQQKLLWPKGQISLYEWSRLDIGTMLNLRPLVQIVNPFGQVLFTALPHMPRLVMESGASISVQASEYNYSSPRTNNGPFTKVEAGFPSETAPATWEQYAEEWSKPTDTVYGYIPIEMVMLYVGAHGGIDRAATFKDYAFKIL